MQIKTRSSDDVSSPDAICSLMESACVSAVVAVICLLSCVGGADGKGILEAVAIGARSVPYAFAGSLVLIGLLRSFVPWSGITIRRLVLPLIGLIIIGLSLLSGLDESVRMNECYILGYRDGKSGRQIVELEKSEPMSPRVMDVMLRRQRENGKDEE